MSLAPLSLPVKREPVKVNPHVNKFHNFAAWMNHQPHTSVTQAELRARRAELDAIQASMNRAFARLPEHVVVRRFDFN